MASLELVDITTACSRRGYLNTVGVVVDVLPPCRTKGSSVCVTFTLKDCHFDQPSWYGGLKVKYFNDSMDALPNAQLNDVVLLRKIRINMFNDKPTGVASQHDLVQWAIFRSEPDPSSSPSITTGPVPFPLKSLEKQAALMLLDKTATGTPATMGQPARQEAVPQPSQVVQASMTTANKKSGLPLELIQDVQPGPFVQILGQVVKTKTYDSEKCIMYLTDYTSNGSLMDIKKDDEDEMGTEGDTYDYLSRRMKNWPGPWGKMTIQVTLWEPHATFARTHVKDGQLVLLTYTRIKHGYNGGIEAAVHQDKQFSNKIHLQIISNDDHRARDLMERRKEYWRIHGKPSDDPKKASRKNKNEQKKKEEKIEEGQKPLSLPAPGKNTNKHIKTRSYEVPPRSIDYILSGASHINSIPGGITYQLPFQNVCYRTTVRVVDFFPPKLEDFAVQVPMESILAGDDNHAPTSTPRMEWEWRFCLLVEGTEPLRSKNEVRAQMKLFVTGAEAVHLLSLDPTNLRLHSTRLGELREKLFILWGDLEELKQQHATITGTEEYWAPAKTSSLPFMCCIKEYGVPCTHPLDPDDMALDEPGTPGCTIPDCFGWERRFTMFGTTIHS
ncbi:hypothetical protein PEBR_28340 [Penicillium brasilianum]|uniref:Protection of telomeres protein 1 n=1 Tax=Penicillium brasilianum TaxID=104259 RepID=A0A1S9RIP9_PENBI|nr:hypothetical protein PEBR_28340 [Penicillium brasilianum]